MLSTDVLPSYDPSHAPASSSPTRRGVTSTVLTRRALPGPVQASVGMPLAEVAAFVVVVPLLSIPVLLATMGAAWAAGTALVLTAAVGWLCAARRVVVGDGWVADRRLWRYRITHGAELRAVELRDTAHGGVLRLSPHAGRAHRVRLSEVSLPAARTALATVLDGGSPEIGTGVRRVLTAPTQ